MAALIDEHEDSKLYKIECTVVTGFESIAKEECFEVFGSDTKISEDRGRVFVEVPLAQTLKALKLHSVENVYVVVKEIENFHFSQNKEADLDILRNLVKRIDWQTGLSVWKRVFNYEDEIIIPDFSAAPESSVAPESFPNFGSGDMVVSELEEPANEVPLRPALEVEGTSIEDGVTFTAASTVDSSTTVENAVLPHNNDNTDHSTSLTNSSICATDVDIAKTDSVGLTEDGIFPLDVSLCATDETFVVPEIEEKVDKQAVDKLSDVCKNVIKRGEKAAAVLEMTNQKQLLCGRSDTENMDANKCADDHLLIVANESSNTQQISLDDENSGENIDVESEKKQSETTQDDELIKQEFQEPNSSNREENESAKNSLNQIDLDANGDILTNFSSANFYNDRDSKQVGPTTHETALPQLADVIDQGSDSNASELVDRAFHVCNDILSQVLNNVIASKEATCAQLDEQEIELLDAKEIYEPHRNQDSCLTTEELNNGPFNVADEIAKDNVGITAEELVKEESSKELNSVVTAVKTVNEVTNDCKSIILKHIDELRKKLADIEQMIAERSSYDDITVCQNIDDAKQLITEACKTVKKNAQAVAESESNFKQVSRIVPSSSKQVETKHIDTLNEEGGSQSQDDGPRMPKFRATCYRTGNKHSFGSPDAACEFGGAINTYLNWKVDLTNFDIEAVLNITDQKGYVALALTKRSLHRRNISHFGPTTLKSTIAHCMLRACNIKDGEVVCDPMCGGGTIPIEAALCWPKATHLCGDNNAKGIERTNKNIEHLNQKRAAEGLDEVKLKISQWDATELPLDTRSVDVVVSDLPFGKKSGSKQQNPRLYSLALIEMGRICRLETGRAALLTQDKKCMTQVLKNVTHLWRRGHTYWINIGGLSAGVYMLYRTSNAFFF